MMCQNCNCDFLDRCSIVGYLPVGFCCEDCFLHDEHTTCLKSKSKGKEEIEVENIKLINASIEGQLLKVVIEHQEKEEKTFLIDLKKYLQS